MKNQYITYTNYLKRENHLKNLKFRGFKIIPHKSRIKATAGLICLIVAILPNGTGVIFYPLSFMLLGISLNDVLRYKEDLKFKIYERVKKWVMNINVLIAEEQQKSRIKKFWFYVVVAMKWN